MFVFFFVKQKTSYEMRISDWSSDVCSSDLENHCALDDLGQGFHRLILNYGFMQPIDVPAALKRVTSCSGEFKMLETSFFLSRQTLIAASKPGKIGRASFRERGCP